MKTKIRLMLIFLLVTLGISAQTNFNSEDVSDLFKEELKSHDNFNFPVKSASESIFLLDSVLETYYLNGADSMLYFNDYYDYDDNGNITEWIHRSTCNNCAAGGNYKSEYIYNEAGNCIAEFYYDLDLITSQWVLVYKLEQNYSASGNLLKYILRLAQNNPDGFINYSKVEYTYNSDNEITDKLEYIWNENMNKWSFSLKWEWEFNNIGQLEKKEFSSYDMLKETWTAVKEDNFIYDSKGYDSIQIQSYWNEEKEIWNNYTKYEHFHDSVGNETTISIFKKDTTEPWIGYNKITNAFNKLGNMVSSEEYHWDEEDSDWSYFRKTEWDFNYNNQPLMEVSYRWDNIQNKYKYSSKIVYDYNLSDQITLQLNSIWDSELNNWVDRTQITYDYDLHNNLKTKNIYDRTDDEVWQLRNNIEYLYSEFTTNIYTDLLDLQAIKIYPNPTKETLTIETQNPETTFAKLHDSTGRLIKTLPLERGTNTYNISELKSGVYFIQVPQKEEMVVRKFVKN